VVPKVSAKDTPNITVQMMLAKAGRSTGGVMKAGLRARAEHGRGADGVGDGGAEGEGEGEARGGAGCENELPMTFARW
jgi:hypothetical protein